MTGRTDTTVLIAALYLSDYTQADLERLRDRASSDVHAVVAELTPLMLALTGAVSRSGGAVPAGRLDAHRLIHCEFTAYTVLGRLCLAELRAYTASTN